MPGEDARARESADQARFRAGNERLRASASTYGFEGGDRAPFICECADPGCYEIVMLSMAEYDRVRANPSWFLLVAGHEDAEATGERIVESENGYAIVEKTSPVGAGTALPQRGGTKY